MDYQALNASLSALTDGVPYPLANLANASALLFDALPSLNWAGFYLLTDGALVLGPFQGKPACIKIPLGRGVCGTAAKEGRTLVVDDVHAFPGHIACDSASNAEIVVPLYKNGALYGVMDLDSTVFSRFTEEDRLGLEAFARILEKAL